MKVIFQNVQFRASDNSVECVFSPVLSIIQQTHENPHILAGLCFRDGGVGAYNFHKNKRNIFIIMEDFR